MTTSSEPRPGAYRVRVELSGFRPLVREGVRLATGETVRLDLQLELGGLTEALTVTADAPLLRSETSALGQVVDNRKIVDLPLNGRSFITLASLAPSVAMPPAPAAPLPRINGGRPRTNEYLFDGISVLQPEPGQVAFFPNVDAIQEFKIESNSPPAEFGRFNGGVVNLTTKSGEQRASGQRLRVRPARVAERAQLLRNRPFPTNRSFGATSSAVSLADRCGAIGRSSSSTTRASGRPSGARRSRPFRRCCSARASSPKRSAARVPAIYDPATTVTGAGGTATRTPFPGNTIPLGRIDPIARALLARFPQPTSAGTANNYRRVADETVDQDQFSVRHRPSIRHESRSLVRSPDPVPGSVHPCDAAPRRQRHHDRNTRAARHHVLVLRVVLSADRCEQGRERASHRRHAAIGGPAGRPARRHAVDRAGSPGDSVRRSVPRTPCRRSPSAASSSSDPRRAPRRISATSVTQIADSLTWVKGRHTLKMGADLRWERLNVIQPASPTGRFTFTNLFTNLPTDATTAASTGTAVRELSPRAGAALRHRPPAGADPEPGALPGVLHSG